MPKLKEKTFNQPTKQEEKMLMHMQELKQSQKAFEQKETDKLYQNLDKNSFKALVKNIPVQIMYERVLDLIEKQGKTIAQVAFELDFSRTVIYNLKIRHATLANTQKLAAYFNVSVDYLIGRDSVQNRMERPIINAMIYSDDLNKAFKKMLKGKSDFEKAFLTKNFKDMLANVEFYRFNKV